MVFRSEAKSIAGLGLLGLLLFGVSLSAASAQTYTFDVRHRHWHGGAQGTLRVSPVSIAFEEAGKDERTHSWQWSYGQIQQLTLTRNELQILTYEDSKWKLGRDREYIFDRLPEELSSQVYPLFSRNLDQRFVAALPDLRSSPEWRTSAKLTQGTHGALGTLLLARDEIVFDAGKRDDSRTWRIRDIENVSTSGPFDLTLTTSEKSGLFRNGMRQFHFQLQSPLPDDRFNTLWREVNRSKGLQFLDLDPDQPIRSRTAPPATALAGSR